MFSITWNATLFNVMTAVLSTAEQCCQVCVGLSLGRSLFPGREKVCGDSRVYDIFGIRWVLIGYEAAQSTSLSKLYFSDHIGIRLPGILSSFRQLEVAAAAAACWAPARQALALRYGAYQLL
jgi:hypothetical protein